MSWSRAPRLLGVVLAAALSASALAGGAGDSSRCRCRRSQPARAGAQCIADPASMRRDHLDLLKHQRDETVHGGIRGAKASLKGCIDCHASAKTGSVAAATSDFCQSCHGYAAVKIDCFECHSAKPATTVARQP